MEGENGQQIQRQGLCQGQPCPLVSTPPPGLAPTDRPPPELQKPFHHTIPAPLSTLQGNKPPGLSLGSLASEHLKTQPSLGLENLMPGSLGALSLHQMSAKCDSGRMKAPSLGSLASNHLDSGGLVPSLASMTVSPSTSLATTNGEQSLGGLTANHLTGLKTIGSSPTLGGLAGTHLSSEKSASLSNSGQNNSSFSLGSLASSHLQVVGKSSLGDLASNHLSTIPAGSSLGSLASNHLSTMPSTGPSLGSLAAVHLSNTNLSLGSQSSNCREKKSSDTSIAEPVVDLTSALKPNSLEPATPVPVLRKGMQVQIKEKVNVSLLVHDLSSAPKTLQKRCASSFGCVVSRKWRRLEDRQPLKIKLPAYQHLSAFVFDTPSPDDIVKSAQAQSRAFRPPTTSS